MSTLDDILQRLQTMPEKDRKEVLGLANKATAGMLWLPNPGPQTDAYFSPADELFYGGQAGGGKSDLLIGLALNEHTVTRLFRRQHNDRQALVDRMAQVIGSRDGYNGSDHVWRIPNSDKIVRFGALSDPTAWERYQGDPTDLKGWDELTQFTKDEYRTVNAWLRTVKPGQRTRIVGAGNPPVTPEGLWVIEYWAAWLDENHPKPAAPGELRYYTTIGDQEDVEVPADFEAEGPNGEIIRPRSRTFIPAGLGDNPDLADTGYGSTLMALPKHLRDALAYGKFKATLEDADRQVIPTAWIIAAQQRFQFRQKDLIEHPMTSLGIDMADGGKDRMACTPLHGTTFGPAKMKPGAEVDTTAKQAAFAVENAKDDPQFNIDCGGGYGGGLSSALESNNFNVVRCKGAEGSNAKERYGDRGFANKRAEWIWRLKEGLDPEKGDNIALPPGRGLLMELAAFREKSHPDSRTLIAIEGNEEISKRLGRSPDEAWSVIFAWAEPDHQRKQQRASTQRKRGSRSGMPSVQHQYGTPRGRR